MDFMAELSQHVPQRGEHTVRYYGRASNKSRGRRRKQQEGDKVAGTNSDTRPPSRKAFRLTWARLLQKVWSFDVQVCPECA